MQSYKPGPRRRRHQNDLSIPDWFAPAAANPLLRQMVDITWRQEQAQPLRAEMKGTAKQWGYLEEVEIAARFLLSLIDPDVEPQALKLPHDESRAVLSAIEKDGLIDADTLCGLRDGLHRLKIGARLAREGMAGRGTGKAWVQPDALSAMDMCASVVTEAWILTGDDLPGPHTTALHKTAAAYWHKISGENTIPPNGWLVQGDIERPANTGWIKRFKRARLVSPERDKIHWILEGAPGQAPSLQPYLPW